MSIFGGDTHPDKSMTAGPSISPNTNQTVQDSSPRRKKARWAILLMPAIFPLAAINNALARPINAPPINTCSTHHLPIIGTQSIEISRPKGILLRIDHQRLTPSPSPNVRRRLQQRGMMFPMPSSKGRYQCGDGYYSLQSALLVAKHLIDHALAKISLLKGMSSAMTFGKPVSARRASERLCSVRTSARLMRSLGTSEDSDSKALQCVA